MDIETVDWMNERITILPINHNIYLQYIFFNISYVNKRLIFSTWVLWVIVKLNYRLYFFQSLSATYKLLLVFVYFAFNVFYHYTWRSIFIAVGIRSPLTWRTDYVRFGYRMCAVLYIVSPPIAGDFSSQILLSHRVPWMVSRTYQGLIPTS